MDWKGCEAVVFAAGKNYEPRLVGEPWKARPKANVSLRWERPIIANNECF